MTRLIVLVEGQTEEAFVKGLLTPHLVDRGVYVAATIVGKLIGQRRGHGKRGGGHYRHWRRDLVRLLQSHSVDLRVTTLFDLYGLPKDFPGYDAIMQSSQRGERRVAFERALAEDVKDPRLLPYIQQYEFETLVLAALPSLRQLLDAPDQLTGLTALEAEIATLAPEDVNDGPGYRPLDATPEPHPRLQQGPVWRAGNRRCRAFRLASRVPEIQWMDRSSRETRRGGAR